MDTTVVIGVFDQIASNFGVTIAQVLAIAAVGTVVANYVKDKAVKAGVALGGWATVAIVGGANVVVAVLYLWPSVGPGVAAGLLAGTVGVLGWSTIKQFRPDSTPAKKTPALKAPKKR